MFRCKTSVSKSATWLLLACGACSAKQPQAQPPHTQPAKPAGTVAIAPEQSVDFPWPQGLTAADNELCVRAEARVRAGLAILDDVWLAATCVLHRLPDKSAEAQALFVEAVEKFRDAPSTARATISVYGKDLPKPLSEDYAATQADPNMEVDVFVADPTKRAGLLAIPQPHLGMGSWRGICLPWQAKAGHSDVTLKALRTLEASGSQFSKDAEAVLTDAAQDADFFQWTKMPAHAQTDSDAAGRPKNPASAQDDVINWVSTHLDKATTACKDNGAGELSLKKALYWLGYSVHALQDLAPHRGRTNPEHSYNAAHSENPDLDDNAIALAEDLTVRYFNHALTHQLKPCAGKFATYKGGSVSPTFKVHDLGLRYDNTPASLLEYRSSKALFEKIQGENAVSIRWFGGKSPKKTCAADSGCEALLGKVLK